MRQREKAKKVADLPNGDFMARLVQSIQETVKMLGVEIDELEVRRPDREQGTSETDILIHSLSRTNRVTDHTS
jgi:hypothetical protein